MKARPLAMQFAALLPQRPRIAVPAHVAVELFDLLVPLLRRPHVWIVAPHDIEAVNDMFEDAADWAASHGWTCTTPGRAMLIHTPYGACRIEIGIGRETRPHLFDARAAAFPPFVGATASEYGLPMFLVGDRNAALSWRPADRADRLMIAPAEGPDRIIAELRDGGFRVSSAAYTETLRAQLAPLRGAVMQVADAARARHRRELARIDAWEARRLRQALSGRLALHRLRRDILALPNGD